MKKYLVLAAVSAAFMMVGCKTPNWLVSNEFHGTDKTVREFFASTTQAGAELSNLAGKDDKTLYFNYTVRVCNVDENGNLSQCMDTVVVEHVVQDAKFGYMGNGNRY